MDNDGNQDPLFTAMTTDPEESNHLKTIVFLQSEVGKLQEEIDNMNSIANDLSVELDAAIGRAEEAEGEVSKLLGVIDEMMKKPPQPDTPLPPMESSNTDPSILVPPQDLSGLLTLVHKLMDALTGAKLGFEGPHNQKIEAVLTIAHETLKPFEG